MEDVLEVWNELLKTVQALTTWPLITLYLVLLFRRALTKEIPTLFRSFEALIKRLATLKVGAAEANFNSLSNFNAKVNLDLAQEVNAKLLKAPDEIAKSQPVDETAPATAAASPNSFQAMSLTGAALSQDQQTIVTALENSEFYWRTRERLLAMTGLTPEQLDAALAALLQQDTVRTAFSPSHQIVFGLRERVQ